MTASEFLDLRAELSVAIRHLEDAIDKAHEQVEIPPVEKLRRATSSDVVVGAVFYYRVNEHDPYWQIVDRVQYPDDDFKAYVAEDRCRYGLHEAWVEIDNQGDD